MTRMIRGLALGLVLTLTGSCSIPNAPVPEPSPTPAPEVPTLLPNLPPDYWIVVDGFHGDLQVQRPLTCTFIGLDLTGNVVTITAQGKTNKYFITAQSTTLGSRTKSRRFPLYTQGAPGLAVIKYECALTGAVGDGILCEALAADGIMPAPLLDSQDSAEVEFGYGDVARCYGVINTLA